MIFKKGICTLCAAVIGAFSAMPAFADAEAELPVPEADENGVYCHAGIVWQVLDQWDHRNEINLEALNETEDTVIGVTHKDVNITGNGEYTVEMSGYKPDYDYDLGFFGVELDLDFDTYADVETDQGVRFEITKVVIDGTEYTFKNDLNEDGVLEQILEDVERGEDGQKMIKIKNSWGTLPEFCEPAMDNKIWTTPDPITMTFTVSGLPTDKIEDNPDEVIEKVYGEGTTDYAAEDETVEDDTAEDTTEDTDTDGDTAVTEDEGSESVEEASSVAAKKADSSKADDEDKDDEDSNLPLILGICGGAVVVIAIVAVVIVKKK
ncbi:MAG: hypothetical protein IJ571_00420 [Ruminococcus sp.]|nr:hypothetical protein [Ruminococcus sp.]